MNDASSRDIPAETAGKAAIFVLVHGAFHGGWCWSRVADRLRAAGHCVYAPTLTGLADRSHLLSPSVTLTTHIQDVTNLIRWEQLDGVVLCGHSYAGMVITGVAEALEQGIIKSIVYLDAYMPEDGQSVEDMSGPVSAVPMWAQGLADSGFLSVPIPPPEIFGLSGADRDWVHPRCTPQPYATCTERLRLTGARDRIPRRACVFATNGGTPFLENFRALASDPRWVVHEIDCGHEIMVEQPEQLAALLEGLA